MPDYRVGGKNYGQELVNQQPAGTYRYGAGPSTYSTIAPGTKTLAAKQFDLNTQQFEEQKRAQAVAEQLAAAKASGRSSSGSSGSDLSGLYQATINEMLAGQARHRKAWTEGSMRSPHNYNSYIMTAINLSGGTLSPKTIEDLRKQADYLANQDAEWTETLKKSRGIGGNKAAEGLSSIMNMTPEQLQQLKSQLNS